MAEKIRIGLPESSLPFVPPADKFLFYLGVPGGVSGVISKLSRCPDNPKPIDPKTVRKAVREGVSPRSFSQIKGILDSVVTPEMYDYIASPYLAPWMETTLRQNGLSWLCIARGMHLRAFPEERPETFTEQFIKNRAEREMKLLQTGLDIQKNSSTLKAFDERWCEYLSDFLKQHTEVAPSIIDRGLRTWLALKSRANQPRKDQAGLLLGLYTRLRLDFYYQLLCNLSLDLIQWFKDKGGLDGHEQWIVENSLFGDMLPEFDGEKVMLPFEKLLDAWRRGAAPDGGDLSWAQIAQCLPNPQGLDPENQSLAPGQTRNDRKEAIEKNKKSRLREWRQGTRPKANQLEQFMLNLIPNGNNASSAILRANIACTWGEFIKDELALFSELGLIDARYEVLPAFNLYLSYWAGYKAQAAQIVAA